MKFDLKAHDSRLHEALTGVSNRTTLDNFSRAAARFAERPEPPLVVASTLLVPGYIDTEEIERISEFIARAEPAIPYALLAFHPSFFAQDLPRTSAVTAKEAKAAARKAGLDRVRIGNRSLLV